MSEKPATETSLISQSDDTQQPPAYSATSTVPDDSAATGNVEGKILSMLLGLTYRKLSAESRTVMNIMMTGSVLNNV